MTMDDNAYRVRSDALKQLREALKAWKDIGKYIGTAIQLRVVVDSNAVIADLRWLASKRKDPVARTNLLEVAEAGTLELFAPPELLIEVREKIVRISTDEDIDPEPMFSEWAEYQKRLRIIEPDANFLDRHRDGADPDDAHFVALAETVRAVGIVSRDRHIGMMGGKMLSIDFVLSLRDYSRAAAVELHIKCMGMSLGLLTFAALRALAESIKALAVALGKAPDWLKITLLLGLIFCVLHPRARENVAALFTRALEGLKEATPAVLLHMTEAAAHAEQQKELAQSHIEKALQEIGRPTDGVVPADGSAASRT